MNASNGLRIQAVIGYINNVVSKYTFNHTLTPSTSDHI